MKTELSKLLEEIQEYPRTGTGQVEPLSTDLCIVSMMKLLKFKFYILIIYGIQFYFHGLVQKLLAFYRAY